MEEYYLICEDSLEGIFSGIYEAYCMKRPHQQIHLCLGEDENLRLFASYVECPCNPARAMKVARTIISRFGEEAYMSLCRALASTEPDKAEAIYKTVVVGLQMKRPAEVMGNLANPYVHRVFELARFAANEAHFHIEFIRFRELENGILYAPIGPKNNIITFLVPHFADRLPLENFVIHDDIRDIFALHPAQKDWYLVQGNTDFTNFEKTFSEGEKVYSELFTHFYHTIAIKERINPKLQRNMLALRYREYMTEFERERNFR